MSMLPRAGFIAACGLAAFLSGGEAAAQAQAGNAERGAQLAYTCLGCHGIPNYKNAYPTYSVPKLAGQSPQYLTSALKAYRSGERGHATMNAQAQSLSDQDIADIAAWLAGQPLKTGGTKPLTAPPKAVELCVACHGPDGVGLTPDYPNLAGQHDDYIARALLDYQKGGRKNPIMQPFAAQLSKADIEAVAAYYSSRRPSLEVPEAPVTARAAAAR